MITPDLMRRAIETAGAHCEDGCPHADAFPPNAEALTRAVGMAITAAMASGKSPAAMIFSEGVHVGYRLRELELEPTTTEHNHVN